MELTDFISEGLTSPPSPSLLSGEGEKNGGEVNAGQISFLGSLKKCQSSAGSEPILSG